MHEVIIDDHLLCRNVYCSSFSVNLWFL